MKTFLTGLFFSAKKKAGLIKDSNETAFKEGITGIAAGKESLTDEQIGEKVEALKNMAETLPESEGKAKLMRFLDDFKHVKSQEKAVAENAASSVADLFEKLTGAALQDTPEKAAPAAPTQEPPAQPKDGDAPPDTQDKAEPPVGEPKDGEDNQSTKADTPPAQPNVADTPPASLEDTYQFVIKRMKEDAQKEAQKAGSAQDNAPVVQPITPVQLGGSPPVQGGLQELLAQAKKGGW